MKVFEKDNVKIVAVEMRAEEFYFLINNKRTIYKLKSLYFKARGLSVLNLSRLCCMRSTQ